ncbi:MAG: hypothetical protein HY827_09875 [Actinobacteria bacterium]|nr:hypothetical protein [Actinomycetota bacterium]
MESINIFVLTLIILLMSIDNRRPQCEGPGCNPALRFSTEATEKHRVSLLTL